MNGGPDSQAPDGRSAESADTIRRAWRRNRDADLAEFFASFEGDPEQSDGDFGDNRLWLGSATVVAVCGEAHERALRGYLNLAFLTESDGEPTPAGRLWYARTLEHARLAGDDLAAAIATYSLGRLAASQGLTETAREHFLTSREYADKAENPGGSAAALYHLAQLAMSDSDLVAASDYAIESYAISRDAGQLVPAAATLTSLFSFWQQKGVDHLAVTLAAELISAAVRQIASGGDADTARAAAAQTLRAIATLRAATRDSILQTLGETFGDEFAGKLRHELDAYIASMERQEEP